MEADAAMVAYLHSFSVKLLPVYEIDEAMSVLRGRIDADLTENILRINSQYRKSALNSSPTTYSGITDYPAGQILSLLHKYCLSLPAEQRTTFSNQTSIVWAAAEQYLYSIEVRVLAGLLKLVESYLNVEKLFDNMSFTDVVSELRKENVTDLDTVLNLCRSHTNLKAKNVLLVKVMDEISLLSTEDSSRPVYPVGVPIKYDITTRNLKIRLTAIARLKQPMYSHVSFVANLVLMKQYSLKPEQRRRLMHEAITAVLTTGEQAGHSDRVAQFKRFIESNVVIRDLLIESLRNDRDYQVAVMELYLLKTYQTTHNFENMQSGSSVGVSDSSPWIKFEFKTKQVVGVADSFSGMSFNELSTAQRSENNAIDEEITASDLTHPLVRGVRVGIMAVVDSFGDLPSQFPAILAKIPLKPEAQTTVVNAVHIVLMHVTSPADTTDDDAAATIAKFLATQKTVLQRHGIRRVTFFIPQIERKVLVPLGASATVIGGVPPSIFTFRNRHNFCEDALYRNIEAPHAYHLDLPRLKNFRVTLDTMQTSSGNVFLYKAQPLGSKGPERYFSRLVSFTSDIHSSDAESLFVEALDNLSLVIGQQEASRGAMKASAANHVFLNIVAPDTVVQTDFFDKELKRICTKYWYKMVRLAVTTVEMKMSCRLVIDAEPLFIRLVASNPTGFVLKVDRYFEATSATGRRVFKSIGSGPSSAAPQAPGPLEGLDTQIPYEISQKFERQRAEAMASSDTLYVYDWPMLFESAAEKQWELFAKESGRTDTKCPTQKEVFSCQELVIHDSITGNPLKTGWDFADAEKGIMLPVTREPGLNDVGMVAWLAKLSTPECPNGREVVLICNDITHQAGSFGTKEDIVFFKASEYARMRGLPRFFLAANSGARIGMAQSLKSLFRVSWTDEKDPSKGFKYIYLTKADYDVLLVKYNGDSEKMPVFCSPILGPNDEERYIITDIIGEEPDLGVENLMGSGLIAGETARAYDEIFTLTMVVGRTVGIGAYLVRLGQRTIQKTRSSPIILTGYQALNKLMGREIYTTNDQLGGPSIMFPNGVSHLLADTHFDSVLLALNWLSFVPATKGGPLSLRDISGYDSVEREIGFSPPKGLTYDPRMLFNGVTTGTKEDATWQSGFFDKGSFVEALGGWAKTVVMGRGRLGGIPMGVIVTENRMAEALKPADPADLSSQEKMIQQAGGVWFPDSAYKTAQALRDFNREGLPCIIFANWRGFSGGQRDMFDEVLKFGSMIVDALVAYQQPLFVYIPPFAELRGGAWVVVDSTINADIMEFYAAEVRTI